VCVCVCVCVSRYHVFGTKSASAHSDKVDSLLIRLASSEGLPVQREPVTRSRSLCADRFKPRNASQSSSTSRVGREGGGRKKDDMAFRLHGGEGEGRRTQLSSISEWCARSDTYMPGVKVVLK